jgi:hypothetical protein
MQKGHAMQRGLFVVACNDGGWEMPLGNAA